MMATFFGCSGLALGIAGVVSLLTGEWLAAIAFGMFAYGALALGAACE